MRNPAFAHAERLVEEGAIGRVVHFRGFVDEDYQADPELAWTWRATVAEAGLGALGDLGCHLVSLAYALMGPVESLVAEMAIVHATRPLPDGSGRAAVENEDVASALVRFAGGVTGVLMSSRSAWGRKNRLGFEVHGERGMIVFEQERMNELRLFVNEGPAATARVPHHPDRAGAPALRRLRAGAGHQLGFNDLKVIEAAALLRAIAAGARAYPDFGDALGVRAGDPRRGPLRPRGRAGGGGVRPRRERPRGLSRNGVSSSRSTRRRGSAPSSPDRARRESDGARTNSAVSFEWSTRQVLRHVALRAADRLEHQRDLPRLARARCTTSPSLTR